MKKLSHLAVAAIVAAFGIAHAAPSAYLQVQGGMGGMDTKNYNPNRSDNIYNKVTLRDGLAYRLSAGYLFGETNNVNYGLELGYASYAKNIYKTPIAFKETYQGYNIDLLGVAKYNFNVDGTGFYVVGKAGAAYVSQKFTGSVTGTSVSETWTKHAYKPEVVAGLGYDFNKNIGMDVTYSHIFAGKADPMDTKIANAAKVSSVNTLLVGLSYHFS